MNDECTQIATTQESGARRRFELAGARRRFTRKLTIAATALALTATATCVFAGPASANFNQAIAHPPVSQTSTGKMYFDGVHYYFFMYAGAVYEYFPGYGWVLLGNWWNVILAGL